MKARWCLGALLAAALLPTASHAQVTLGGTPTKPSGEEAKNELDTPEYWGVYRPQLEFHPIGHVLPAGRFRFTNLLRMHPSGFPSDEYEMYASPTYGLPGAWEVSAGVVGAERLGAGGNALFYGAGIQKGLLKETRRLPAVSAGLYGMLGPHDQISGTFFLSGSKLVAGGRGHDYAAFLHAGGKLESYDGDDYGNSTGLRPYVGASLAIKRRFFISTEFSPSQPWERDHMFAVRGTYVVRVRKQTVGITGGIRNAGYGTHGFVGLSL